MSIRKIIKQILANQRSLNPAITGPKQPFFNPVIQSQPINKTGQAGVKPAPSPAPKETIAARFFDLDVQGNIPRVGQSIPVQYGRAWCVPDMVALPISEVTADTEVHYYLFCIGLGSYQVEKIYIGGTLIDDVPGVSYEIAKPGQPITIYPTVLSSGSLENVLLSTAASQTTVVNITGTTVNALHFDLIFKAGLYSRLIDGTLDNASVIITFEYAPVGSGTWTTLGSPYITAAQSAPFTKKFTYNVPPGHYEVRVSRNSAESVDPRIVDAVHWVRTRASSNDGHPDYGDVTLLAVKSATGTESFDLKDMRLSVLSLRELQTWNNLWQPLNGTSSIVWALADVIMAEYGAGLTEDYLDLFELKNLDDVLTARGDYFNGRFENPSSVMDVIATIARAGRCITYQDDGVLRVVRDEVKTIFDGLFTPSNIVSDSVSVEYVPHGHGAPDSILAQFESVESGEIQSVLCTVTGTSNNTEIRKYHGIDNIDHAFREGMYDLANDLYRRTTITFITGLEGLILRPGNLVLVALDNHDFGQWGDIFNIINNNTIVTSNPVSFFSQSTGTLYVSSVLGGVLGPFTVQPGASAYELVGSFSGEMVKVIQLEPQPSRYAFSTSVSDVKRVIVTEIEGMDDGQYRITGYIDDDRVHTADQSTVPETAQINWYIPKSDTLGPTTENNGNNVGFFFSGLSVINEPGWIPRAHISWLGGGYDNYLVEISFDGNNFSHIQFSPSTTAIFHGGNLMGLPAYYRVTPFNKGVGDTSKTLLQNGFTSTLNQIANVTGVISL